MTPTAKGPPPSLIFARKRCSLALEPRSWDKRITSSDLSARLTGEPDRSLHVAFPIGRHHQLSNSLDSHSSPEKSSP